MNIVTRNKIEKEDDSYMTGYFFHFQLRIRNPITGFVRPLVRQSIRWSVVIELKNMKTRIIDAAVVIVHVCEFGKGEGMDGGCMRNE